MEMTIRRAGPGDVDRITALDAAAWDDGVGDGSHTWRLWVDAAHLFVAEEAGSVEAVALGFLSLDGDIAVHKLFVDRAHRGKGLGRAVLEGLLGVTDGEGRATFLTVAPENAPAQALYQSLGYRAAERRLDFYGPGEHRDMMRRPARG